MPIRTAFSAEKVSGLEPQGRREPLGIEKIEGQNITLTFQQCLRGTILLPGTTYDEKIFTLAEKPGQSVAQQAVFKEQEDTDGSFVESFHHGFRSSRSGGEEPPPAATTGNVTTLFEAIWTVAVILNDDPISSLSDGSTTGTIPRMQESLQGRKCRERFLLLRALRRPATRWPHAWPGGWPYCSSV